MFGIASDGPGAAPRTALTSMVMRIGRSKKVALNLLPRRSMSMSTLRLRLKR